MYMCDLPLQDRADEAMMAQYKAVEAFYKKWHDRVFKGGLAWKKLNKGISTLNKLALLI
jgi:hypothetical protein